VLQELGRPFCFESPEEAIGSRNLGSQLGFSASCSCLDQHSTWASAPVFNLTAGRCSSVIGFLQMIQMDNLLRVSFRTKGLRTWI